MRWMLGVLATLTACLLLLALLCSASAAETWCYTYTVTDGEATITSCDTSISGDVTIPEILGGCPVTAIDSWAFEGCVSLTGITIPESVTDIGACAFYNCTKLTNAAIPGSVSTIGDQAFDGCTGLTGVTMGNGVDSIGAWAFRGCTGLTDITIPDTVTAIGQNAFENCTGLTGIVIPNSVISIDHWAFRSCTGLTSLTIPDSVTDMVGEWVFEGCSIEELIISDGSKTVTSEMVVCKPTLKSVIIPDSVTSIDYMSFYDCVGLTSVTMGNGVTDIGASAFQNCTSLTHVTIGSGVTIIGQQAFYNCAGLTGITISDSVTSVGTYAFRGCNIEKLIVADGVKSVTSAMIVCENTLKSVIIPNGVTTIGDDALSWCHGLTSLVLPDSVTTIGERAFSYCTGLESIIIPESVTALGAHAFEYCSGLTSITIPDSVVVIGAYAFKECDGLTEIAIENGVAAIGEGAFSGCSRVKSIMIPDSITSVGEYAFGSCNLCAVFYCGTKEQKSNINFGDFNDDLFGAAWHYEVTDAVFLDQECYHCTDCDSYLLLGGDYVLAKIVFYNWDGSELSSQSVRYNGTVILPVPPVRQHDQPNVYQYVFNGWDREVSSVCKGNASYTATFKEEYVDYTVEFKNWDGATLSAQTYHWGETVVLPTDPIKDEDDTYVYTFAGWDNEVALNCEGNAIYTATYTKQRQDGLLYSIQDGEVTITGYTGNAGRLYIPCCIESLPVTRIGERAFEDCSSLSFIIIPGSVICIERSAFLNCTGLTEVDIGDGVTSIGDCAFSNCTGLTDITIPDSVTGIGYGAFTGCSGLESMTLPFVGENNDIFDYKQYPLGWIFGQPLPNTSYPGFSKVAQKYEVSGQICAIDFLIPNSLKSVTVTGSRICYGAFLNCIGLTNISMLTSSPEAYIGAYAFYGCSSLESLTIPYAFTNVCMIFGDEYYSGSYAVTQHSACSDYFGSLKTYYLPRTLKNITITHGRIEECAFDSCYMLENIVLGSKVYAIDRYAFNECSNLKSVHLPTITYCDADAFSNPWGPYGEDDVQDVWYTGTLSDRENIVYNTYGNKAWFLRDATWHYSTCINGHTYSSGCDTTCNSCEWVRSSNIDHIYDNECDTTCNHCDNTRTVPHSYVEGKCEYCGDLATYVVVFTDEDGTELSSNTYHWGESITIPTNPTKPADNTYSYTFAGWDKPLVDCAGDVTYIATYTSTYIEHTVIFQNSDGSILFQKTYHYGETVEVPAEPQKPGEGSANYVFAGWDREVTACTGNAIYTAVYALACVQGDMNDDGEITDADALYLLRHTLFPQRYPLQQSGDVNGDGEVTDADALYLLRYTLFPQRYPLYNTSLIPATTVSAESLAYAGIDSRDKFSYNL